VVPLGRRFRSPSCQDLWPGHLFCLFSIGHITSSRQGRAPSLGTPRVHVGRGGSLFSNPSPLSPSFLPGCGKGVWATTSLSLALSFKVRPPASECLSSFSHPSKAVTQLSRRRFPDALIYFLRFPSGVPPESLFFCPPRNRPCSWRPSEAWLQLARCYLLLLTFFPGADCPPSVTGALQVQLWCPPDSGALHPVIRLPLPYFPRSSPPSTIFPESSQEFWATLFSRCPTPKFFGPFSFVSIPFTSTSSSALLLCPVSVPKCLSRLFSHGPLCPILLPGSHLLWRLF